MHLKEHFLCAAGVACLDPSDIYVIQTVLRRRPVLQGFYWARACDLKAIAFQTMKSVSEM